ncbi:Hsp70 family protein [Mycolicibacterium fluoranthenivorans]|uniref:Molecular chaperone n=1 Tax=Mycolicibacterium fluoranthenivorans TaxID=258505 RepID=A0A7X5TW82_9MYCO|nr:Hsp70 family protein [Mycolicibacterium fluoranthenivorans]MCV7355171.1 Hsp70 family protein [Mycolicibacterium fluoranthenivorans]NIH93861.1 hypothetical protein [Mycolicibacterium fluoranthenivorans]
MSDPLGLSIGTTNLVATSVGGQSVTRRAVLTLPTHGTPAVGVSTEEGLVLTGFVERVGDPVPLVASDGSSYAADDLLVEALEAMIAAAGADPVSQTAIAFPAHWTAATVRTLRAVIRTNPVLAPSGTPPRLVSDAVAALTSLRTNPGLQGGGPVVLLDFGGGGTSITLVDAGAAFEPLDETLRVTEFSGDLIDQAVLTKVLAAVGGTDPAATAAVGLLGQLREECRHAKERLSAVTATEVPVALPGERSVVRLTRAELEELLAEPFAEVLAALDNLLQRNRITFSDLSAVATVGGGASIPLITQLLSEHTRIPVVTTPQPALDAAVGAALFAAYGAESDLRTGLAPIAADAPTGLAPAAPDAPTGLAAAAQDIPTELGPASAGAVGALAWSQDDDATGEPVSYAGGEIPYATGNPYGTENPYTIDTTTRAVAQHVPGTYDDAPRAWQRLPILVFAGAGVLTLVALGGVAIALTGNSGTSTPTPTPAPATRAITPPPSATPPAAVAPPATEAPPPVLTVTTEPPAPPPPPQTQTPVPEQTVTVTKTYTTHSTTTTTTPPTTTTTPPTTTTTEPTTTTTETTTTTTTPAMTTSYIKVPFLPVPIPIQVPNRGETTQTTYPYAPQYPNQPTYP